MDSHILNTYHQAQYRTGHNRVGSTSESCSSESSCPQNSPEYPGKYAPQPAEYQQGEEWEGNPEDTKVSIKVEDSSESSSDDDEIPDEAQMQQNGSETCDPHESSELVHEEYYSEEVVPDSDDDYEIVVDDEAPYEGPIIQVYAVDPNLDLEASEDEQDYCIRQEKVDDEEEEVDDEEEEDEEEATEYEDTDNHDNLGINLDTPVVSNVDEYFIKEERILDVKDQPVVSDVDEYFIKDDKKPNELVQENTIPNVDDFFVKNLKVKKEVIDLNIVGDVPNVEEFFNKVGEKTDEPIEKTPVKADAKTDSDILPHIEHIKRFLLEDMPCPKFQSKSVQRSCSLPHSPAHMSILDVDDARTSLSFEDLNLDLSDFNFSEESKVTKGFDMTTDSGNKSDDIPRTLTEEDVNSFLITNKPGDDDIPAVVVAKEDDLNSEDMEIECPVEAKIECSALEETFDKPVPTSTPVKAVTVLGFCIEKPTPKVKVRKEKEVKVEADDFVDVESLNDTVIPVLAANNVSSLLEQFEATEKINTSAKRIPQVKTEPKEKTNGLANGTRQQDAAVQLNKNKMRQILMSTPTSSSPVVKKSSQTIHSDHDYCSPKKRHSLPTPLKGGQSLLKPEVLSSNNKILSSRHRSCKNKKVVYHMSSDDEGENNNGRNKSSVKPSVKAPLLSNHRKKLSPPPPPTASCKSNISVISNNASKASDNYSQSSSGSIKLTIKNKSKVILNIDCDDKKDSHKCVRNDAKTSDVKNVKGNENVKPCDTSKPSDTVHQSKPIEKLMNLMDKEEKVIQRNNKQLDSNKNKIEANSIGNNVCANVVVKEEPRPVKEDFYTALFQNKKDIQITLPEPVIMKRETKPLDSMDNKDITELTNVPNIESKPVKKKLNLQEYKLRKEGVNSNGSSRTVSPEAIFPDMPGLLIDKTISQIKPQISPPVNEQPPSDGPKKLFDPIREASRKIIANTKKQKAIDATRKRDEDIVMSKIPKVENLELQPLISDAEMLKIVGMTSEILPVASEKPKINKNYEELILFSVGTNTDQAIFRQLREAMENEKRESKSPDEANDKADKSTINFKIKKSENILKQNVFDPIKKDRKTPDAKRHTSPIKEPKIDKKRYKDITATIKSVEKQTKISSNSLFASIQDVVMKKAPDEVVHKTPEKQTEERKSRKLLSPVHKSAPFFKTKATKIAIVREYDAKIDHGEDKIILHLKKNRSKPGAANMVIQTEPNADFVDLAVLAEDIKKKQVKDSSSSRKRTASDMSVGSDTTTKSTDKKPAKKTEKPKSEERKTEKPSGSKERNSRSKDRYESKYRRGSHSRSRRSSSRSRRAKKRSSRSKSRSRCRSRSVERYRRYRRSDSPYRRRRRSVSYRRSLSRRSHSKRRDYRSNRTRTRSRSRTHRSRSPVTKKVKCTPEKERKSDQSMTPPLRKPTLSESSDSSSSSSRSSRSSASSAKGRSRSRSRRRSCSPVYRKRTYRSYSSEVRDCTTPVEERRIVFVGKLEKEATKSSLRSLFTKFGHILEVTLHSKEDGCRYGFVTYSRARDAWSAVESASHFPQYDVGFGGRRAFCRQRYADLDGIEVEYNESAYLGAGAAGAAGAAPARAQLSFEQMLRDVRQQLSRRRLGGKEEGE